LYSTGGETDTQTRGYVWPPVAGPGVHPGRPRPRRGRAPPGSSQTALPRHGWRRAAPTNVGLAPAPL